MGYYIFLEQSDTVLPKGHQAEAYKRMCALNDDDDAKNGGSFGPDGEEQSVAFQATMTKGVGTPLWMAPELFVGGTKYGPEVDVYSFGVIMWELATRKIPWEEEIATTQYIMFFAALAVGGVRSLGLCGWV